MLILTGLTSGNNVFPGGAVWAQFRNVVPDSESLMAPGQRRGWGERKTQNTLKIQGWGERKTQNTLRIHARYEV